jgi:hypothetical protein
MTQSRQHDHSPKNLVQVRIKELADGLMSQQGGRKAFLDLSSGQVVYKREAGGSLVYIKPITRDVMQRWLEDFALTLDEGLQLELRKLLQGMNSFFCFYAFIDERASLKEAWEAFEMQRLQEHLRQMVPEFMQLQLV